MTELCGTACQNTEESQIEKAYFIIHVKHSCETQLIGFTQEIADSLDQGQQTDVIVMDFSKAFDKVDHHKLVHKMKHMGVNPYITTWIKDFLHNRSQQNT